jgi:hypothetical protein
MPLPNWDENLQSTSRFTILPTFNNDAVRDNNTGLVWARAPIPGVLDWYAATSRCLDHQVSGTTGWRLPSVVELNSVRDPTLFGGGGPFTPHSVFPDVGQDDFWSATTVADDPSRAWFVSFAMGQVGSSVKTANHLVAWCVRGPMNADKY